MSKSLHTVALPVALRAAIPDLLPPIPLLPTVVPIPPRHTLCPVPLAALAAPCRIRPRPCGSGGGAERVLGLQHRGVGVAADRAAGGIREDLGPERRCLEDHDTARGVGGAAGPTRGVTGVLTIAVDRLDVVLGEEDGGGRRDMDGEREREK